MPGLALPRAGRRQQQTLTHQQISFPTSHRTRRCIRYPKSWRKYNLKGIFHQRNTSTTATRAARSVMHPADDPAQGAHGHGQAGMTQDLLQGQDVAAVLDEVAGEGVSQRVSRLPFGNWIVVLANARRNEVIATLGWPCCFQCWRILASSSAVTGTERTFPLLVPLNVITPLRSPVGLSFSASDHRAPVATRAADAVVDLPLPVTGEIGFHSGLRHRGQAAISSHRRLGAESWQWLQ